MKQLLFFSILLPLIVSCATWKKDVRIIFWPFAEEEAYKMYGSDLQSLKYTDLEKFISQSYSIGFENVDKIDYLNSEFIFDLEAIDYNKTYSSLFSITIGNEIILTGIQRSFSPVATRLPYDNYRTPVLVEEIREKYIKEKKWVFSILPYYTFPLKDFSAYAETDKVIINKVLTYLKNGKL